MQENYKRTCLVMLRNDRLSPPSESSLCLYLNNEGKWKESDRLVESSFSHIISSLELDSSALDFLRPHLTEDIISSFADFDCHLDNVKSDWRNVNIFQDCTA